MKDALKLEENDADEEHRPLDIEGRDRVHTLFSGTTVVVASPGGPVSSGAASDLACNNIATPDGGALCLVLRTGFSSSQGELMQMIEFSTEQVTLVAWCDCVGGWLEGGRKVAGGWLEGGWSTAIDLPATYSNPTQSPSRNPVSPPPDSRPPPPPHPARRLSTPTSSGLR